MGPIFVYTSFAFICVGALFRPSIGMLGYIGFVALTPHWLWRYQLFDAQFPFQKYIAIATMIGFLLHQMRGTKLGRTSKLALASLVAYLGISFISSMQSIAPEKSDFFMAVIYKPVLMTCLAAVILSTQQAIRMAMLCVVIGVGWNAYEINSDYFSKGFSLINQDGWAYLNANGFALILVIVTFLSLSMSLHARSMAKRLAFLLPAILCVHAIYIVESRGCMLGLIASGITLFLMMEKNRSNLMMAGLALVCAGVLAGPSVIKEFNSAFADELDNSAESRFYMWGAGVRITRDYPLLGVGPWAAETIVPQYYAKETDKDRLHLHNLPLEVSTGSGIPALVAYLLFFGLPLYSGYRVYRHRYDETDDTFRMVFLGVFAAMPGYWVASMFNSGALIEMPYLVIAVLIAAMGKKSDYEYWPQDKNHNEWHGDDTADEL